MEDVGCDKTENKRRKKINLLQCLVDFPWSDPALQHVTKITMRPGSMVIWDSRLPHGNFPNLSEHFRMVQYITFYPQPAPINVRAGLLTRGIELTELGEKVTGEAPYLEEECTQSPILVPGEYNANQWY
eukprot:TRINITY_DN2168_c0_g1_i2.p1 TRINITY_DN2168_c0_g1~~TRINITY_DN2168_c0_g1_i2.p1  ORF type:complete len:141 (-),score=13.00 TRINITY_DN2168_c0_g1_i2:5-391(-)